MIRRFGAFASLALLAGCANVSDTSLTSAPAAGPHPNQVIGYTGSAATGLLAMSPGKAAFGMIGGIAMAEAGKRIVRENNVEDPAAGMARGLAHELADVRSAQLAPQPLTLDHSGMLIPSPEKVAAAAGGASYVVDIETQNWGFAYYPTDWFHYHVMYLARVRLVDAASKTIAAEHVCKWDSDKREPRLTSDELLDGGAKGLKSMIAKGALACQDEFRGVLGLSAAKSAAIASAAGS